MAYLVSDLISRAFYLSQVVSRELETVTGQQQADALIWLNALLSLRSANTKFIPYYTLYQFNAVPTQEVYFVPNLVQPETLTFNIGPVRYSTQPTSRRPYQGAGRVDNIYSLPFNWNFERVIGGANISLYFVPDQAYPIKIWGRFGFSNVAVNTDLETIFDEFYIDYLRYRLAMRICSEYGIPLQPQAMMELEELEDAMRDIMPPDMSLTKVSDLQGTGQGITWADVNLGRGWRPGN
jgi:hypothetical protein